ncbi:MAG TPA: M20/M25/M40 family metallo-hydrolase [Anaerolineales bacterium]|jgi:acetylornithine deacetylase/succinyl-diaminopimelate desuccinylase-like protein
MIDWNAIGDEAAQLLSSYLKIKSVNPPGDERETAEFLTAQLRQRGLEPKIYISTPNRVNLLARLPGDGTKKPILLYSHMDVVEADPQRWSCDPFGGEIRDGYVWGRGAIDMKGMGIMQLLALDLLQCHHPNRSRDIIFLATADEEKGGGYGTRWLIENQWPEIEAEYVWDEGSFGLQDFFGPTPVFTVAVAEKKELWLKLIAHGEPGHSGMPHDNNAANILVHALERVRTLNSKYELNPVTRMMFLKIGEIMPFPKSFLLKNLHNPLIFHLMQSALTSDPTIAAMLKDTLSITVLRAGGKENIIPDSAEATLDIRLLPDRTPEAFLANLKKLITDKRVDIEVIQSPEPATISDVNTEFYQTLSDVLKEVVPASITAPMLTPGTTDSCFFRSKGVNSYGLFPAILTPDELVRFHGIDERISIENLRLGTRITYQVLHEMVK